MLMQRIKEHMQSTDIHKRLERTCCFCANRVQALPKMNCINGEKVEVIKLYWDGMKRSIKIK